jgi:glutamine amidotransferase
VSRVVIVDYGLCNIDSVARSVEECGAEALVTCNPDELNRATHIILPGVGAFPDAMDQLEQRGLIAPLRELVLVHGVPFLGICLGMQLMGARGTEGGDRLGLGLVPGRVIRLVPEDAHTRIPHAGWNEVQHASHPLFAGIPTGKDFYFVHSYHFACERDEHVIGRTPYCGTFASAIQGGPVMFGVQFHPEKSQAVGRRLLQNFLAC